MTRRRLFAIGLGAYLCALVAILPATIADSALRGASNGRLRLVEATGTLWSGAGLIELRDEGGRSGISKDIAWHWLPQSLIGGHLVFDVDVEQSPKHFPVTISFSRINVANADIRLPAAVLGLVLPKLAPLGLGGDLLFHITDVFLQRGGVHGSAILQWRSASSALTPIAPLGDYELHLDGERTQTHATLRTLQGPLMIDGNGSSTPSGEHTFLATIRVPENLRRHISPTLRLIAVERSEGVFEFQFK